MITKATCEIPNITSIILNTRARFVDLKRDGRMSSLVQKERLRSKILHEFSSTLVSQTPNRGRGGFETSVRYCLLQCIGLLYDLLQVLDFTGLLQISIFNKSRQNCQFYQVATVFKIRLVANCHLQACYILLKQACE